LPDDDAQCGTTPIAICHVWTMSISGPAKILRNATERGGLGRVAMNAVTGVRRALVHIRGPHMERRGGCLEAEPDDDQGDGDPQQRLGVERRLGEAVADLGQELTDPVVAEQEREARRAGTRSRRRRRSGT